MQYATMDRGKTDWPAIYYELVVVCGISPHVVPEMTYDQVNMLIGEIGKRRQKEGANINALSGRKSQTPLVQRVVILNPT